MLNVCNVINRGWGSICRNCLVWPCLIRGLVPKTVLVYNVVNLKLLVAREVKLSKTSMCRVTGTRMAIEY